MNDVLGDDAIIARLRSALDEVTAGTGSDVVAVRPRSAMTPARWTAVAAAALLVVGGVAAIAVNRRNAPTAAEPPPPTTALLATTTTESLVRSDAVWYTIVAPYLVPGEVTFEGCCSPSENPDVTMAWQRHDDGAILNLGVFSHDNYGYRAGNTLREVDGFTRVFQSYGLTVDEREQLADQVVAGSGLPYVLPVEGWNVIGMSTDLEAMRPTQLYTPANPDPLLSYIPTVTLSVGEYHGELAWLSYYLDVEAITIAGNDGWSIVEDDGTVHVIWPTPDGSWANLRIDAGLQRQADGIIVAVTEVAPTSP